MEKSGSWGLDEIDYQRSPKGQFTFKKDFWKKLGENLKRYLRIVFKNENRIQKNFPKTNSKKSSKKIQEKRCFKNSRKKVFSKFLKKKILKSNLHFLGHISLSRLEDWNVVEKQSSASFESKYAEVKGQSELIQGKAKSKQNDNSEQYTKSQASSSNRSIHILFFLSTPLFGLSLGELEKSLN